MKDIKITGIETYICGSKPRHDLQDSTRTIGEVGYIIIDIETNFPEIRGVGICYCESGSEATCEFIKKTIFPEIEGMNPMETEIIWEKIYRVVRGVGRKGLAFAALSGVDIGLWDIKGKVLDMPLYRLLGGNDPMVPVYASGGWTSYTLDQMVEEALQFVDDGFSMIKIKVGVQGGTNPREDIRRVEAVRKAIGPDIRLGVDANNVWQAGVAVKFAKNISEFDIEFFEEPVIADDIPGLAFCRSKIDMPLGTGEHEYTKWGLRDILTAGAVDIVQVDTCKTGGYTETIKQLGMMQAFNVVFAPHCQELVHMHLVAAAPNGYTLEDLTIFREARDKTMQNSPKPQNGYFKIPDLPGLGVIPDMDYIKKHSR